MPSATANYGRNRILGAYADGTAATAACRAHLWDVDGTGLSNPFEGALYWDTTLHTLRQYTGSTWHNVSVVQSRELSDMPGDVEVEAGVGKYLRVAGDYTYELASVQQFTKIAELSSAAAITTAFANADGSYDGYELHVLAGSYSFSAHLVVGSNIRVVFHPGVTFSMASGCRITTQAVVDAAYYSDGSARIKWDSGNARWARVAGANFTAPGDYTDWYLFFAGAARPVSSIAADYIVTAAPSTSVPWDSDVEARYFGMAKATCKNVKFIGAFSLVGAAGHDGSLWCMAGTLNCDFGNCECTENMTDADFGETVQLTSIPGQCFNRWHACYGTILPRYRITSFAGTYEGSANTYHTGLLATSMEKCSAPEYTVTDCRVTIASASYSHYAFWAMAQYCSSLSFPAVNIESNNLATTGGSGHSAAAIFANYQFDPWVAGNTANVVLNGTILTTTTSILQNSTGTNWTTQRVPANSGTYPT